MKGKGHPLRPAVNGGCFRPKSRGLVAKGRAITCAALCGVILLFVHQLGLGHGHQLGHFGADRDFVACAAQIA